jgi:hypothetical protein
LGLKKVGVAKVKEGLGIKGQGYKGAGVFELKKVGVAKVKKGGGIYKRQRGWVLGLKKFGVAKVRGLGSMSVK